MAAGTARNILFAMFLLSLALQIVILVVNVSSMWPEEMQAALLKVIGIYAVPLAVILGSIFAKPRARAPVSVWVSWAALILAAFWNLLLLWRTVAFGFAAEDSIADLMNYLESASGAASFLIAGALAFFFGKAS